MAFARPLIVSAAAERAERLARVVYELLDAHHDTELLVRGKGSELDWDTHLDYLRTLQRLAREVLAEHLDTSARAVDELGHTARPDSSETSGTLGDGPRE
jgi:hypothetical protein